MILPLKNLVPSSRSSLSEEKIEKETTTKDSSSQIETPAKKEANRQAVLPHIQTSNPLPEKGSSDVNFDQSFLHKKKPIRIKTLMKDLEQIKDPGAATRLIAQHTDAVHVERIERAIKLLENKNQSIRQFSILKRGIQNKDTGDPQAVHDLTEFQEELALFQAFYNKNMSENKKLDFTSPDALKALKAKNPKELEAITTKIDGVLEDLKNEASDLSNEMYLKGHLYTIVMTILQELTRTDCRGKERMSQASRSN